MDEKFTGWWTYRETPENHTSATSSNFPRVPWFSPQAATTAFTTIIEDNPSSALISQETLQSMQSPTLSSNLSRMEEEELLSMAFLPPDSYLPTSSASPTLSPTEEDLAKTDGMLSTLNLSPSLSPLPHPDELPVLNLPPPLSPPTPEIEDYFPPFWEALNHHNEELEIEIDAWAPTLMLTHEEDEFIRLGKVHFSKRSIPKFVRSNAFIVDALPSDISSSLGCVSSEFYDQE